MTEIYLVRHGETNWNKEGRVQGRTDIPLNETGRMQAKLCFNGVKEFEPSILIASPLQRAKVTAEILNEQWGLPIIEMEEFKERSYGDAEGMTLADRERFFPDKDIPNMEKLEDVKQRGIKGIQEVCQRFPNKKIVIVAHGALINAILSVISKGEIGTGKTHLNNTCINKLTFVDKVFVIKDYNNTDHLITVND
ncbi:MULTISPECIES: histidine phosphatase family protein [Oceanobacillus]|uniref:Phosphatase PhoE n=1 Tax=Oceanobacillus kimchii TaxID=746691 RepID=A0ABQ5TEN2_9BACI|nr:MULTISPECIES: histidine phosphatase family protein [Oceanobacillus]MBT2653084.1 histidine phosphatase family protein [Oceanobacillus sp. ISL-73]MCT1577690.1 histidine phosphatase family protein [Oceanobacillus kimchii]MCT2136678.1 histidine phosphatase family protein [Oceanobacillus kimchii]OEH53815.1 phosphatase [Oceanobacillus sp. E9]GLO64591.1 putative phosphatase PhoE [Oceanobacillus kimchii]